jgi:cell division septum initiation protein DivIVA
MGRMQLVVLLDRLERTIESGAAIPLTGKVIVEKEEVLELVEEIRQSMPEEIEKATWIMKERDNILREAHKESQDVIKKAKEHVGRSISESDIVKQARAEADRLIEESKRYVKELQEGADQYADASLAKLENTLLETLKVVKKGRSVLKSQGDTEDSL